MVFRRPPSLTPLWILGLGCSVLIAGSGPEDVPQLISRLASPDQTLRDGASAALRTMPRDRVLPSLMQALGNVTPGLEQAVKDLVKRLAARSWAERDRAARDLTVMGRKARPFLESTAAAEDPQIRWRIHEVLLRIRDQEPQEEVHDFLQKREICRILAEIGDPSCEALLIKTLAVKDVEVRKAAVEAIIRLKVTGARKEIIRMLPNAVQKEQFWLVRAVGVLGGEEGLPAVQEILKRTENSQLKDRCLEALVTVGTAESVRIVVLHLSESDPFVSHSAMAHLMSLTNDDFGFDPDHTRAEKKAAVRKFVQWWEKRFKSTWKE